MKIFSTMFSASLGLVVAIICVTYPTHAINVRNVPNPRASGSWVTDMENVLSVETEAQINQLITNLEAKNGTEIAVVTVPNTSGYSSPKKFTTALFNRWGIGKRGIDNGVLFMISIGDRRVEIETGYGVEYILPDAKVGHIIDRKIIPQFKQGDFEQGILDGTKALVSELSPADFAFQKIAGRYFQGFLNYWQAFFINLISNERFVVFIFNLSSIGLFSGGVYKFLTRRRYIKPQGRSHCSSLLSRPVYCKKCKKSMNRVDESLLNSQLTEVERFSKNRKYMHLSGWQCPNCKPSEPLNFHILFTTVTGILQCPKCNGWTVRQTREVIRQPTYVSAGSCMISKTCQHCDYHKGKTITIPKLVESSSSSDGGMFDGGSSSSGSSDSSSSGGGSDFGGGSSGGGGAGGSW